MVRFPKYNMVRKVVDHRIAGDSEWLINRTPLQSGYFKALKQYFLSNLITNVPVYTCLLLATFGSLAIGTKLLIGYYNSRGDTSSRWQRRSYSQEADWVAATLASPHKEAPFDTTMNASKSNPKFVMDWPHKIE